MLGSRKVDSVEPLVLAALTVDSTRAGALRTLALFVAEQGADIFSVHGIDEGDALALATRFDLGWGYRGAQALFWKAPYRAQAVHDLYLPAAPLRPFERRGLLRIDGTSAGAPLALFASEFSADRARIREMRFARSAIRAYTGDAIIFTAHLSGRVGFADLGFSSPRGATVHAGYVDIATRGWESDVRSLEISQVTSYIVIVARPSQATPPPQTAGSQRTF